MVSTADPITGPRLPLSRGRVLSAAVELADAQGMESLTMRNLAGELGVEAMSLYYHVANKEALLDGVVDTLLGEIEGELGGFETAVGEHDWMPVLRTRILTARQVMLRHPWAPAMIETRSTMTPTLMRYFDTSLGILVEGGFSNDLGHHAMHALGSRLLGFNQELFVPDDPDQSDADTSAMLEGLATQLPYLVRMLAEVAHDDPESTLGWCDDQSEFEFGLDILLDGLEKHRSGT
jgi:AcrR family transcriptional regulator